MPDPTSTEAVEREALKLWINERKVQAFEYLSQMVRGDAAFLKACGYNSKEDAFVKIMANATREIEKKIVAHERKFPH